MVNDIGPSKYNHNKIS